MAPPSPLEDADAHMQFVNECGPTALFMFTRFIVPFVANVTAFSVAEQLVAVEEPAK
jgi:hypothetical protein